MAVGVRTLDLRKTYTSAPVRKRRTKIVVSAESLNSPGNAG